MNTGEFLSRWSRRKRRATAKVKAADDVEPTCPAYAQTAPISDLPNLVPLETIGAETDIRAFLADGVPSELARAALRRAWLSDPKIRDFVGLADYDWDFNTPGSMAGFGTLEATDQIERELARLVRGAAAVTTSETPFSPRPIGEHRTGDENRSVAPPETGRPARLNDESTAERSTLSAPRPEEVAEEPFRHHRKHGRALPK